MLGEILSAGWEFVEPLVMPTLQAGLQRAGEQGPTGPYLQVPGARQEAAASLYGAPQTPGGGLDPRQGGGTASDFAGLERLVSLGRPVLEALTSIGSEGGQTKADYAKTMGVTVYDIPKTRATPHGTLREVTVYEPDGSERVELLEPHAFIKDGQKHFGVSPGSAGNAGLTTVAPAATPSSGTPFDMPVDIDILTGQDLSFGPLVAPPTGALGASPLKAPLDFMADIPVFGGAVLGATPAAAAPYQSGSLFTPSVK